MVDTTREGVNHMETERKDVRTTEDETVTTTIPDPDVTTEDDQDGDDSRTRNR